MIVTRLPLEWLSNADLVILVCLVGVFLGGCWIGLANKYKTKRWGLLNKMSSVIFTVVMLTIVLVSSAIANVYNDRAERETQEFISDTVATINQDLEMVSNERDMIALVEFLYDAEYQVVSRRADVPRDTQTIGDIFISGNSGEVSNYITSLTEEERVQVLDTNKESLNAFTLLEFAELDTVLDQESFKLGSLGRGEVLNAVEFQRDVLESRVRKLDFSRPSAFRVIYLSIIISAVFGVMSVLFAILLRMVVRDTVKELGLKSLGLTIEQLGNVDFEEYKLVDGDLQEPDGAVVTEGQALKYELSVLDKQESLDRDEELGDLDSEDLDDEDHIDA